MRNFFTAYYARGGKKSRSKEQKRTKLIGPIKEQKVHLKFSFTVNFKFNFKFIFFVKEDKIKLIQRWTLSCNLILCKTPLVPPAINNDRSLKMFSVFKLPQEEISMSFTSPRYILNVRPRSFTTHSTQSVDLSEMGSHLIPPIKCSYTHGSSICCENVILNGLPHIALVNEKGEVRY